MNSKISLNTLNRRHLIKRILSATPLFFWGCKKITDDTGSILFKPLKIKNMKLRNRFVRSATYDGCSDRDGHVTEKQLKIFSELANGGIGLIITGLTNVHHSGQLSPVQS